MTTKLPYQLLEDGTAGEIFTWDATGAPATVAVGTAGQVLTSNGAGAAPTFQNAAGGGLNDVVDDTTPQLGGNLDINGFDLVSTANADIDIIPNGTGNVNLGNMAFDADQTIGAGQDNYVLTYDNGTGLISLEASAGGGGGAAPEVDTFSGTGAQTTFTLVNGSPSTEEETQVYVDGVYQFKGTYSLSAGDIVFTTPPALGTNNIEVMTILSGGGAGGGSPTPSYTSPNQTLGSAGSTLTLAHGLGEEPELVQLVLECQTAELGYSIGDKVILDNHFMNGSGSSNGQAVTVDSTNVNITFGGTYQLIRKDTGANAIATNGNWQLIVKAWGTIGGGGATSIDDLSDVDTSTTPPTDGQVLTWNNANAEWEPQDATGGGNTFESTAIAISSGGNGSVAHGLGAIPELFYGVLVCKTAEFGYSVGDEVSATDTDVNTGGVNRGFVLSADATNIDYVFGDDANPIKILNKTTGAAATLTNANWDLVIRASEFLSGGGSGGGDMVLLGEVVASGASSVEFINGVNGIVFDGTYKTYELHYFNVITDSANADISIRTTSNGGGLWDATGGDYRQSAVRTESATSTVVATNTASPAEIRFIFSAGIAAQQHAAGRCQIFNPADTTDNTRITFQSSNTRNSNGEMFTFNGAGERVSAAAVDGIQIIPPGGSNVTGTFKLYGFN